MGLLTTHPHRVAEQEDFAGVSEGRPEIEIRDLYSSDAEAAAALIANAFVDETLTALSFDLRDEATWNAYVDALQLAVEQHFDAGHPVLGAYRPGEGLVGICLVKSHRHQPRWHERIKGRLKRMPKVARLYRHSQSWSKQVPLLTHPPANLPQKHFLLEIIAVAPHQQRLGIGQMLLKRLHDLAQSDAETSGIYLVTADAGPRDMYRSFGYRVLTVRSKDDVDVTHLFWDNPAFQSAS